MIQSSKRVRFACTVTVRLIPTVKEYNEENLAEHLWWNMSDYSLFKQSAVMEVQLVLKVHPLMNASAAIKLISSSEGESSITLLPT